MNNIETFDYHINWKTKGHHPGQHKSDQRGMGIEFAGHSNLIDYPVPGNDDATKSIECIVKIITQAISEGLAEKEKRNKEKAEEKQMKAKEIIEEKIKNQKN